ncbi:MAG: hypothetical protein ACI9K2_000230 [Myxococcota bacterium]|jgi:hypothetical protein
MLLIAMLLGAAQAQSLATAGTCPGAVIINVDGATPGGQVMFMGSSRLGSTPVPIGSCAGIPTAMDAGFRTMGPFVADGDGVVTLSPSVGARLADLSVQALDLDSCGLTDAVALCGDGAGVVEFDARHERVDVAMLIDTTCSMAGPLANWTAAFPTIASELNDLHESVTFGLASYDDYNDASFGSGADKPFILRQQQTSDSLRLRVALADTVLHGGADGPESGNEVLYQALVGAGYDQNCNRAADAEDDVPPFRASPSDAFGGVVFGVDDPGTPGTGELGGLGFREGALPILVITTDNQLRDPEEGYGSPGGCALDAAASDVVSAANAMGARIVGVNTSDWNDVGREQLESLANSTGALVDRDGDGVLEPAVIEGFDRADIQNGVLNAVMQLTTPASFDEISLVVTADAFGSVQAVVPAAYVGVEGGSAVPFTLLTVGELTEEVTFYPITVQLRAGDYVLSERTLYVDR